MDTCTHTRARTHTHAHTRKPTAPRNFKALALLNTSYKRLLYFQKAYYFKV
uniref:Uncharacterized protein n=1 Tax=Anguilla anguilla TaxID=7936 RepID=A0A0E9SMM4_ANGAN